jgi:hypothetical protein
MGSNMTKEMSTSDINEFRFSSEIDLVVNGDLTRYQYLNTLLGISYTIARLTQGSSDHIFSVLSSIPKENIKDKIRSILESKKILSKVA